MTAVALPRFRAAGAAVLAALLAACGGGGDGILPAPEITVNINLANQQQVARASFGSSVSGAVGGFTGAATGGAASPLALKRAQSAALAVRKRIAADVSADLCPGGGMADASVTDTSPVGQENVGDSAQITFVNCDDGAGTVASGVLRLTISSLSTSSVGFTISTTNFSVRDTATGYTASLDGSFGLALSGDPGVFRTRLSVGNQLVLDAQVGTISDTISLLRGYATEATYTVANATTSAVADGPVGSVASGGTFDLSTLQPLLQTDNESYPHAGQIEAVGKTGKLRATVLSNTQVRIDVDANNNGTYDVGESSVVAWTDLL